MSEPDDPGEPFPGSWTVEELEWLSTLASEWASEEDAAAYDHLPWDGGVVGRDGTE